MKNYFQGTLDHPYHISIGAVVKNTEGKICCHYFDSLTHKSVGTLTDFILLMRETIEPNETIEQCLMRGLWKNLEYKHILMRILDQSFQNFNIKKQVLW